MFDFAIKPFGCVRGKENLNQYVTWNFIYPLHSMKRVFSFLEVGFFVTLPSFFFGWSSTYIEFLRLKTSKFELFFACRRGSPWGTLWVPLIGHLSWHFVVQHEEFWNLEWGKQLPSCIHSLDNDLVRPTFPTILYACKWLGTYTPCKSKCEIWNI